MNKFEQDRITALEHQVQLLMRQSKNQPLRIGRSTRGQAAPEKFRLIRGRTVATVAAGDATFLVNQVVARASGIDPTNGNPAAAIRVFNQPAAELAQNESVLAIYSPGVLANPATDWELVETGDGGPTREDIRGYSVTAIAAATGIRGQPRTPGTGTVRLHVAPADGQPAGAVWAVGLTHTAENWMQAAIAAGKPLLLRASRLDQNGNTIYIVVAEGCAEIPDSPGGQP